MPPTDPRDDDEKKPPADALPDLPDLPENTDLIELNVDLDPGAPEPIDEIPIDEVDLLVADEVDLVVLSTDEPEATHIPVPVLPQTPLHLVDDDLEDFATQEELPIVPWSLEVELLELGVRLPAVLDPTRETSEWERPDPDAPSPVQATVRIRMLDLPVELTVVPGEISRLRLGRDVIGGRVLIATD